MTSSSSSSSSSCATKEILFPYAKLGIRLNENTITWVSDASKTLGAQVGMKMIKIAGINVSGMRQEEAINVIKANSKRPLHVVFEIPQAKSGSTATPPKSKSPAVTRSGSWEIVDDKDAKPKTTGGVSAETPKKSRDKMKTKENKNETSSPANNISDATSTSAPTKVAEKGEETADPADVTFMTNALRKLHVQRESGDLNEKDYEQTVASFGMSAAVVRKAEATIEAERKAAAEKAEEEAAAFEEVRVRQLTDIQHSLVFPKDVMAVQLLDEGEGVKKSTAKRRRRRLVLQGEIERFRKSHSVFVSALRDMYLFLLSDMLLVTDRKKSLFKKGKKKKEKMFSVTYEVAEVIPLDQVGIVTLNDLAYLNEKDSDRMFSVQSPVREHRFVAQDRETKAKWLDALKTQLLELTSKEVIDSMIGYEHMVVNGTFFSSCMIGRPDILKKLVAMLPPANAATSVPAKDLAVNAFDSQGFTALHYAAHTGNAQCARILCAYPQVLKDFASKRPQHDMPIHMTAIKEHAECTKLLLESGATASVRDAQGRTPLDLVVYKAATQPSKDHSSHRCVRIILSHRGSAPLNSSKASSKKTAHSTLSNSDPLSMFRDLNTGDSILMCVAAKAAHQPGAHHVANALVEVGASINQRRARGGQSSLHLACANPRNPPTPDVLATLLRAGAEPNLVDEGLNTPLHYLLMSRVNQYVAAKAKGKTFVPTASRPPKDVKDVHLWEQTRKTAIQTLLSYGARLDVENRNKCMVSQILTTEELSLFEKIYANWQGQTPSAHVKESECLRAIGALVAREDKHVDDGDSNSCQLCGLPFSTFTRRHHCRSTGLLVCWYCSTKAFPLIREIGGRDSPQTTQAEKVTDGQFNKLLWDSSRWTRTCAKKKNQTKVASVATAADTDSIKAQSKTASASAMRDEMRSAAGRSEEDAATKKKGSKRDPKAAEVTTGAEGAQANVAKALKTVSERTEKLNETVLAAEELANSADEFENMAKLLAEREDKKFFGLGKFF